MKVTLLSEAEANPDTNGCQAKKKILQKSHFFQINFATKKGHTSKPFPLHAKIFQKVNMITTPSHEIPQNIYKTRTPKSSSYSLSSMSNDFKEIPYIIKLEPFIENQEN